MPTVADVMRTEFIVVAPEDTLGEVAQRMVDEQKGGAVLVKDFGRMIGILTERDMLKAMAGRVHTSDARVREWMTPDPITAPRDLALEDASRTMLEKGFRHLPILDGERLVGIVSLRRVVGGMQDAAEPGQDEAP
jgi:CBS domain-containing protein